MPYDVFFWYRVVFGLLGTVIGAVLSIIVWEIARGNPYGIAVLTFFAVFIPFEYLLMVSNIYDFLAIMTLFAYLMVNNNKKKSIKTIKLLNGILYRSLRQVIKMQ